MQNQDEFVKSEVEKRTQQIMKQKKALAIKSITAAGIACIILLLSMSFAWFTFSNHTIGEALNMKSEGDVFELKTVGEFEGSTDSDGNSVYSPLYSILDGVTSSEYEGTATDSELTTDGQNEKASIKWILESDNAGDKNFTASGGIKPGDSGKLTFYVKPKVAGTFTLKFTLDIKGYYEDENDVKEISGDNSGLLKGHILFFEEKQGNSYSGLIAYDFEKTFTFEPKENKSIENQEEIVEIHWVWPSTFGQIVLTKGPNLGGRSPIFANPVPPDISLDKEPELENGKKDKASLMYFMSVTDPYAFFEKTSSSSFITAEGKVNTTYADALLSMAKGDSTGGSEYNDFSIAYNHGDDYIGHNVDYILLKLDATCVG